MGCSASRPSADMQSPTPEDHSCQSNDQSKNQCSAVIPHQAVIQRHRHHPNHGYPRVKIISDESNTWGDDNTESTVPSSGGGIVDSGAGGEHVQGQYYSTPESNDTTNSTSHGYASHAAADTLLKPGTSVPWHICLNTSHDILVDGAERDDDDDEEEFPAHQSIVTTGEASPKLRSCTQAYSSASLETNSLFQS